MEVWANAEAAVSDSSIGTSSFSFTVDPSGGDWKWAGVRVFGFEESLMLEIPDPVRIDYQAVIGV